METELLFLIIMAAFPGAVPAMQVYWQTGILQLMNNGMSFRNHQR